jgi:AraC family transcriptional regulator
MLVETEYGPGVRLAPHGHERPYFCFVVRGDFHERSAGRQRLCGAGGLIFHPAGETHADRFGGRGAVCFNIEVAPAVLTGLAPSELAQAARAVEFRGGVHARLARYLHQEFHRVGGPSALVLEGLGLALTGEACRAASFRRRPACPTWLSRALELLHDRFREPIGLALLAAEIGVHPVHLARTFRRHTGRTVGEYIRALRIEFARAELMARHRTIAQIAHASGFADHAHFCRWFRASVGMSPSQYRSNGLAR